MTVFTHRNIPNWRAVRVFQQDIVQIPAGHVVRLHPLLRERNGQLLNNINEFILMLFYA